MPQIYVNGVEGLLSAQLTSGSTEMQGSFLADLPSTSGGFIVLVIDPDEEFNEAEVVHVDGHSAGSTTAQIVRAQENTFQPASHPIGTKVVAGVTAAALTDLQSGTDLTIPLPTEVAFAGGKDAQDTYFFDGPSTGGTTVGFDFSKPAGWGSYDAYATGLCTVTGSDVAPGTNFFLSFVGTTGGSTTGAVRYIPPASGGLILNLGGLGKTFTGDGTVRIGRTATSNVNSTSINDAHYSVLLIRKS